MKRITAWLEQARHPSQGERFALPNAIYFLLKFRPDLAALDSKTLADRVAVYLWWESVGQADYPDFDWMLRSGDLAFIEQLSNSTLIAEYPACVAFWLKSIMPSLLDGRRLKAALLNTTGDTDADRGFPVPDLLRVIVEHREDLTRVFDLSTVSGRLGCTSWWQERGQAEYPRVPWSPTDTMQNLLAFDGSVSREEVPLPRLLHLIRDERPDLRDAYDLTTFAGRVEFLGWWHEHRQKQYPSVDWTQPAMPESLFELDGPDTSGALPLPRFLLLIWQDRADLQKSFDISGFDGRLAYLMWWNEVGQSRYPVIKQWLEQEQAEYPRVGWSSANAIRKLLALNENVSQEEVPLPRLLHLIRDERPDLRDAYDLTTFAGRIGYLSWWNQHAKDRYPSVAWTIPAMPASLFELDGPGTSNTFALPRFLLLIWQDRADLQNAFHIRGFEGRLAYLMWWNETGQTRYPLIKWSIVSILYELLDIEEHGGAEELPCPRLLQLVHDARADLSQAYDLGTFVGRIGFLDWWNANRKAQYPGINWTLPSLPQSLYTLMEPGIPVGVRLPRFLHLLHRDRDDLQRAFNLNTFSGCLAYLGWWEDTGHGTYSLIRWSAEALLPALVAPESDPESNVSALPRFLRSIHSERPDLQASFAVDTPAGAAGLVSWWQAYGRNEYQVLRSVSIVEPADCSYDADNRYVALPERIWSERPFGVNIVGFPQGVLGIGEDARMAAHALELAEIPRVLVNAPMAGPAKVDHSADHLLSADLQYGLSIFCLPPPEMLRLALEGGRKLVETDTYRIGAWPWELPQWPSAFGKLQRLVDEIWAQSKFVQSALARQGETPVHHMPMAVTIPAPVAPDRKRLGLPEEGFLFYLMFDGNSWLTRKNPVAGVHAFQKAFGAESSGVRLVIKAMNVQDSDPTWREVSDMAAKDDRIHIVSERLSRQDTIDLMAACDAYISLHRSEGFGRVIAEAMLLGQPVVATNFSGNVDFCSEETAFLVDGELVPLRPGDYLFYEGQYWCDPDVSMAAEQIRTVFEDSERRARVGLAGRERIARDYSVEAVARAYAARIANITGGVERR
jgi:glycosyltransferase involved in cell wall biosynthesis